jgi:hypothetical protein
MGNTTRSAETIHLLINSFNHQCVLGPCKDLGRFTWRFRNLVRYSVGFLWTSDQPITNASTYTEHSTKWEDRHPCLKRFRPHDLSIQAIKTFASDRAATGGWVGPRAGLDTEATGKILCPCWGSNLHRPVVHPAHRSNGKL